MSEAINLTVIGMSKVHPFGSSNCDQCAKVQLMCKIWVI